MGRRMRCTASSCRLTRVSEKRECCSVSGSRQVEFNTGIHTMSENKPTEISYGFVDGPVWRGSDGPGAMVVNCPLILDLLDLAKLDIGQSIEDSPRLSEFRLAKDHLQSGCARCNSIFESQKRVLQQLHSGTHSNTQPGTMAS